MPDRLIDAAEMLIGERGVDGASLRQIGAAAGTVNNYAVQYHFGGMDDLIRAIFERRMPSVDIRMRERLDRLTADQRLGDTQALVDVLLRPLLDELDDAGERAFARFLSAVLRSSDGARQFENVYPLTEQVRHVLDLLLTANPHLTKLLLFERLRLLSIMVFSSVFNRGTPFDDRATFDAAMVDDVLRMTAAGVSAPTAPDCIAG